MTKTNYATLDLRLERKSPTTDPPPGLWDNPDDPGRYYPGLKIEYQDNHVLASDAAGHYQFSLSDHPDGWTNPRVVDMAFKQKPDGEWTRVEQQAHSRPFWVTRWATDTQGIGLNDVPTSHPGHKVEEDYDLLLVIAHGNGGATTYTCCDPEIHNERE